MSTPANTSFLEGLRLTDTSENTDAPFILVQGEDKVIYKISKSGFSVTTDPVPTEGSTNAVQSGGTKAYIDTISNEVLTDAKAYADLKDVIALAAAKSYADGLVIGLTDLRGYYNPATNSNLYPTTGGSGISGEIKKGDVWVISGLGVGVSALIGTKTVTDGDEIMSMIDAPGNTDSNWNITEHNFTYVPENSANKSNGPLGNSAVLYTTEHSVKTYVDQKKYYIHKFYKLPTPLTGTTAEAEIFNFTVPALYAVGRKLTVSGKLYGTGTFGKTIGLYNTATSPSVRNIVHSVSGVTNALPFKRSFVFYDDIFPNLNNSGQYYSDDINPFAAIFNFDATPFKSTSTFRVMANLANAADSVIAVMVTIEIYDNE